MPNGQRNKSASMLPFGQYKSQRFRDANDFTDAITRSSKTLLDYDALEKDGVFDCLVSSVKIGNIDLVASSSSPSRFSVKETKGLYFCFLYDGRADASIDGFHGNASANEFAFLSPEVQRSGETTSISMVQFSMRESDVLGVASQMFGQQSFPAFKRSLQRPKNIDLRGKNASCAAFLKGIIQQIDTSNLDGTFLETLGVEDAIHRTIAAMVAYDEDFYSQGATAASEVKRVVRDVTEFMDAHIEECIKSTDLERVAGVGTRALQYSFLKSYGCSPMQWLRSRRLELARVYLLNADQDARIIDVALSVGWHNISSFPSAYAERYGERPSETLKRKIK